MDKMIVRVPVAVKAKVTEDLKLKIVGDLQNTIKNMELDLEQFEFQAKKALHQAASDVIVHVFDEENRLFYDLERIWRDGKVLEMDEFLEK